MNNLNTKSLPEMNYIVLYFGNTSITLHYYLEGNDIVITTGEGETYKCWRGSNNDLTNLKAIVNNFME